MAAPIDSALRPSLRPIETFPRKSSKGEDMMDYPPAALFKMAVSTTIDDGMAESQIADLRRHIGTFRISPAEFDEVAAELGPTLYYVKVRSARRQKSWQPSPRHKGSYRRLRRALNAAEAMAHAAPSPGAAGHCYL